MVAKVPPQIIIWGESIRVVYPSVALFTPLKIFLGFPPPPSEIQKRAGSEIRKRAGEGWKIGKEGWNHEKRAKTAKIWLEIMKRRLEFGRGMEHTHPQPQNFTPPLEKKPATRMALDQLCLIFFGYLCLSEFTQTQPNLGTILVNKVLQNIDLSKNIVS